MPDYDASKPGVKIVNRCSYDVNVWSILKGQGCPSTEGVVLSKGGIYQENYRQSDTGGVSVKVSKTSACEIGSLTQLEYFIDTSEAYGGNYLDVSYVDCSSDNCPTKAEGYYMQAGTQIGAFKASSDNQHCPILSCSNASECATMSYILPDDTQTKYCPSSQSMEFYMCGGEAPGSDDSDDSSSAPSSSAPSSSAAPSSSDEVESSSAAPSSTSEAEVETPSFTLPATTPDVEVQAAAVTEAPSSAAPNVKTEVVYVTKFEYVNAKRHAHGHRHQHFRA
ncbi:hypothetical protein K491DRAFT_608864 [Lophiostoma macrostomum CBS 122681]|uniref:Uncharacterized protein n=1 Tax=Lophiostoma macrostomum CBS 122681 TaxID=1314788 RepID=A0A6A6SW18_9PLEO|nr:hypothetical protein K491DRAFT_608864 [Lophiostoma macrostomum CBS 122681]